MAAYAVDELGLPRERVIREETATNSWENVQRRLSDADGFDQIAFASDPFHTSQALRHARKQRPAIETRLRRGPDYRPLEKWWLKPARAVHALWHNQRDWRFNRAEARAGAKDGHG